MLSKRVKLLIVDDEPALRESLSQLFIACGYSVCSAQDGFSALDRMKQGLPDIILSDLNMAGMSGFDFLPTVRSRFPAIHLIAMSASFTGNEVPPGVVADAFYPKATGVPALLHIVKTAVNSRHECVPADRARIMAVPVRTYPQQAA